MVYDTQDKRNVIGNAMKDNFSKALKFVLKWEGYLSENPDDPGGLTIFGISKRHWPKEVEEMSKLELDKALMVAQRIYKTAYWDALDCDNLPYPEDIVIFDSGVNCGVSRAKRWCKDSVSWVDIIMDRLNHYNSLKSSTFMAGWVNRLLALYKEVKDGNIIT